MVDGDDVHGTRGANLRQNTLRLRLCLRFSLNRLGNWAWALAQAQG
jgi:hypothetical protein